MVGPRPSLVGRVLCGKWRVEEKLGEGGTSTVYRAVHRNGKRVAVKVLADRWAADERARGRFLREGYVANKIGHDGAVTIFDDDVEDGVVFLVMELLEGETLSGRLASRRMTFDEVLDVGARVLEILASAHAAGVIHRDVKPSNVFLTRENEVKLLDFGLAHVEEDPGATTTATGTMMGTPAFMAPEQARGRWKDVDARSDLWAVGATLFTALSGRHVHRGSTANEVLIAAATQPPQPLASIVADVPASIAAVIDRALAFSADDRWPNAEAMAAALRSAREGTALSRTAPIPESSRAAVDGVTTPEASTHSLLASASIVGATTTRRQVSSRAIGGVVAAVAAVTIAVLVARHGDRTTPSPPAASSPSIAASAPTLVVSAAPAPTIVVSTPAPTTTTPPVATIPVSPAPPAPTFVSKPATLAPAKATPPSPLSQDVLDRRK